MSDLDHKLREIVDLHPYADSGATKEQLSEKVAQIKQAFIDADWIPPEASAGFRDRFNIMRGQEWYERFEKELEQKPWTGRQLMHSWAKIIAKKASGIK